MKSVLLSFTFAGITAGVSAAEPSSPRPPNVLFIAIDDLNDWVEPLGGHPQVKTPNFNRLAQRGTTFLNAHCQSSICNPSRASLLTGLRPSTTGIYGLLPGHRDVAITRDVVTLPQAFQRAGYHAYAAGKIYHESALTPEQRKAEFPERAALPARAMPKQRFAQGYPHEPGMDWGPFPERDEQVGDYRVATAIAEALQRAPKDRPFFIAAGFSLPHVPLHVPQKWFDLYPAESLQLPPVREDDRDDTPPFSWYLHWKLPEPRLSQLRATGHWAPHVRGYLASISFMDAQVGRVLDALEASGHAAGTIVVLWSDHGYHLGEKLISGKNTLWEPGTRVPFIWAGPGIAAGARSSRPVELLDIYPTLLELCGLVPATPLEGHSLVPLLRDAYAPRPWPAITTHNRGSHSVRTERWRYIRYADGSEELYDHQTDPREWTNLLHGASVSPELLAVKRELAAWLPRHDAPPAPGSARRVLVFDPKSGTTEWEGEKIDPAKGVR